MRHKDNETTVSIIEFVNIFFDKESRSPSLREIEYGTGISRQTAQRYLKDMDNNGIVRYDGKRIVTKHISECLSSPMIKLNLVGSIPCGDPTTEEIFCDDHIFFPRNLLSDGNYFVLRASGDSMVNAGIDDQDLVIVRYQETAKVKQIIAALDSENRNTLKRLMYDGSRYYLHPENPKYEDIYPEEIKIQGIAVKVIKNL